MIRRLVALALVVWLVPASVQADCTTSDNLAFACTAGTTDEQVGTAITNALDGATLTFAAGSYTWNGAIAFSNTKALTLICESVGDCDVTAQSMAMGLHGTLSGTNTKAYRISGFDFTWTSGSGIIRFYGPANYSLNTLTSLRMDHLTFNAPNGVRAVIFGSLTDTGYTGSGGTCSFIYGVLDHITFTSTNSSQLYEGRNDFECAPAASLGSANNLFLEDSTISIGTLTDDGLGCIDWQGAGGSVIRFNRYVNCRMIVHGVNNAWGPTTWETYGNAAVYDSISAGLAGTYNSGGRQMHHQGSGYWVSFWNRHTSVSGHSASNHDLVHYRSFTDGTGENRCDGTVAVDGNRTPLETYYGYPCHRQPGRDINAVLFPVYVFLNRWTDDEAIVGLNCFGNGGTAGPPEACDHHTVENRDFFDEAASFTGATGVGSGALASAPGTCQHNTEAADAGRGGVGYFATNQGSWNVESSSVHAAHPTGVAATHTEGADGRLYTCTSANTFTSQYEPYTYPHTLVEAPPDNAGRPTFRFRTRSPGDDE